MKKFTLLLLLLPMVCHAYEDHRGRNLDSLERVAARYTPDKLATASREELTDYAMTCRWLAWAYLQLDGTKCVYYGKQAMRIAEQLGGKATVFDVSILIGQCFWASEKYDSAAVYYNKAAAALASMESDDPPREEKALDADRSRLWGTMGNFYVMQDSIEQASFYYNKAAEIFDKYEEHEQNTILYYNLGEIRLDAGDKKQAKADYDRALSSARQSGDSLMVALAMKGLGRYYKENGQMLKALEYLQEADQYYGSHPLEEPYNRAETLDCMTASYQALNKSIRAFAVALVMLLVIIIAAILIALRLKRTKKELTETAEVLDETIEELRPASEASSPVHLAKREKQVARLIMEGKTTKEIASEMGINEQTVFWYRKRLYAKLNVHSAVQLTSEMQKLGLDQ